jgi:hypothetical protein
MRNSNLLKWMYNAVTGTVQMNVNDRRELNIFPQHINGTKITILNTYETFTLVETGAMTAVSTKSQKETYISQKYTMPAIS